MTEYILILATSVVLMAMVFAGMSISMLIRKNGRFPVISIGRNNEMKKRGITCVKHDEMLCHGNGKNRGSCCS
ncbi:MAG: hypothetical protein EA408_03730 [Marinilabiliales bacterium]|nr:MAG: hypothetical protein EA408_03730 [Marinilabiliales bacterium]